MLCAADNHNYKCHLYAKESGYIIKNKYSTQRPQIHILTKIVILQV